MKSIFVGTLDKIKQSNPFILNHFPYEQVAIFYIKEGCFTVENRCPHVGAFLHEGQVERRVLPCPWHGLQFD